MGDKIIKMGDKIFKLHIVNNDYQEGDSEKKVRKGNKYTATFFFTLFMLLVIYSIIDGEYLIVYVIFSLIFCLCIICFYVTYDKDKIINKIGDEDENEDENENKNKNENNIVNTI